MRVFSYNTGTPLRDYEELGARVDVLIGRIGYWELMDFLASKFASILAEKVDGDE